MDTPEKIKRNVLLAPLTTFKIGGPAKYFIEIKAKQELVDVLSWAKEKKINYYILGGGSNLLISDQGIDGLVLVLKNDQVTLRGERLEAGAGATLAKANSSFVWKFIIVNHSCWVTVNMPI